MFYNFFFVTATTSKKLECVFCLFFQPRPIFESKGGAYPSGAHAASNITVKLRALLAKNWTDLKDLQWANTLAFCSSVGDEEKKFYKFVAHNERKGYDVFTNKV
jgi:hypothetical protein